MIQAAAAVFLVAALRLMFLCCAHTCAFCPVPYHLHCNATETIAIIMETVLTYTVAAVTIPRMSRVSQHQRFLRPQLPPLPEAALAEEFAASREQRMGEGREQVTVLLQQATLPLQLQAAIAADESCGRRRWCVYAAAGGLE